MKITMIAEAEQVELKRLGFHHLDIGNVRNVHHAEIRLPGYRTQAGELRTIEFDKIIAAGMLVIERFQHFRIISEIILGSLVA
ncbi:hypothetical protein D3C80_1774060 [compost metagenome]